MEHPMTDTIPASWRARIDRADAILARGPVVLVQEGDGVNRADRRHVRRHRDTHCARCIRISHALAGGVQ